MMIGKTLKSIWVGVLQFVGFAAPIAATVGTLTGNPEVTAAAIIAEKADAAALAATKAAETAATQTTIKSKK